CFLNNNLNKEKTMQQTFPAGMAQKIVIFDVRGDLIIHGWEQQTLQVTTDGRLDQLQPEGDVLTIRSCDNTLELNVPFETDIDAKSVRGGAVIENVHQIEIGIISGDVSIKTISGSLKVAKIGSDAAITGVVHTYIDRVDGDLVLIETDEVIVKRVGGDLYS